jgi:hypothetical protein
MDIDRLSTLTANEDQPARVPIFQKNGDPLTAADGVTQCVVFVLGSDSKPYRREQDAIARAQLRSRKPTLDPEDLKKGRVRAALSAIVGWEGFEADGKPAACIPDHVKAVLAVDWILVQVEAGITAHADFFANSSASSSSSSAGTLS